MTRSRTAAAAREVEKCASMIASQCASSGARFATKRLCEVGVTRAQQVDRVFDDDRGQGRLHAGLRDIFFELDRSSC